MDTVEVVRHVSAEDLSAALQRDARAGLTSAPKILPPKWFYDARGSELFEDITRLEEYYPTRLERDILQRHARDIARASAADTLVELGSGSSEKTRILLDALRSLGTLRRYVPVDVSDSALLAAGRAIAADYPGIDVHAVVADFEGELDWLPVGGCRLVAFLGSTIGNLLPAERAAFLAGVRAALGPGDSFLLGTDLVKDPRRLVAAYDDALGVTAAFNLNVLRVLNRELGADFNPAGFEHAAVWDPDAEWIEMRLRATAEQQVHVAALGLDVHFEEGEEVRTEVSAKFRLERVRSELAAAGLALRHWWTDPAGDYALSLSGPR